MSDVAQFAPTTTADTIFVELFQSLRKQVETHDKTLELLAHEYLAAQHPDATDVERLSAKSNIIHELTAPTMTAKVFFKGLKILQIESLGLHATTFGPEGSGATAHAALELK